MDRQEKTKINIAVKACLADVQYLVGRESKLRGLDSTEVYEAICNELAIELENNIKEKSMKSELTLNNKQNTITVGTIKKDIVLRVDGPSLNEPNDIMIHQLSISQACSLIQMLLDGVKEVTQK